MALLASLRATTRQAFLKAAGESQEAMAKQAKIDEQEALVVSNSSKVVKLEADLVKLNVRLAGFESKVRDLNKEEVSQRLEEADIVFRKNTNDLAAEDDFRAARDDYARFEDVARAAALVKTQVEAIDACKEVIRESEAAAEVLRAELNQLYSAAVSSFNAAQSEMAQKRTEVHEKLAELRNNRPMIEKVVSVKRIVNKKAARKAEETVDVSLGKASEAYVNINVGKIEGKKALPNAVGCAAFGFADERRQQAFDRGMEIQARKDARDSFMPGWPQYRLWDDQDKRMAEAREAKKALSKRLEAYKAMKALKAKNAVITVGIPGCGKSTWAAEYAKQTGARVIELDMARAVVNGNAASQDNFAEVLALHKAWIAEAAAANQSIVVSDTNLVKQFRDELKTHLESLGYVVDIKVFFTSHEVSRARNASRDRVVPEHAMDRMIQLFDNEFGAVNA
jgi:predicted kinase